jgi:hypothetical protein
MVERNIKIARLTGESQYGMCKKKFEYTLVSLFAEDFSALLPA